MNGATPSAHHRNFEISVIFEAPSETRMPLCNQFSMDVLVVAKTERSFYGPHYANFRPSYEKHFSFSSKSIFVSKPLYLVIHSHQYLFTHLTVILAFSVETFRHCSSLPHTRFCLEFEFFSIGLTARKK